MKLIRIAAVFLALAAAGTFAVEVGAESSAVNPKAVATSNAPAVAQLKQTDPQQTDKPARSRQTRFKAPARVPAGQLLYLQKAGERDFKKLITGAPLGDLDCIEINCPASFPAGATCWRCTEQIQAPEAPGSE